MATTLCYVLSQQLVAILREFTQTKNTNLTACMGRIHLKVSQNIPDTFLPPVVGLCLDGRRKKSLLGHVLAPGLRATRTHRGLGLNCALDFSKTMLLFEQMHANGKNYGIQVFQSFTSQVGGSLGLWLGLGVLQVLQEFTRMAFPITKRRDVQSVATPKELSRKNKF